MANTDRGVDSQMLDLVWAVSGRGLLLRAIIAAADAGLIPVRVRVIVTDRACPIEPFAAARGIPVTRVAPPTADRTCFDRAMAESFRRSGARWAGLTFNRLIGPEAIGSIGGRVLNVHFALLPLFPGFGPLRQAIASGMRVAGVTVHLVDARMDGGAIIGQTVSSLSPADTEETLGRRLFAIAVPLVLQVVRALADTRLSLNADCAPVWSPGGDDPLGTCFPSIDPDLVEFGHTFCVDLR